MKSKLISTITAGILLTTTPNLYATGLPVVDVANIVQTSISAVKNAQQLDKMIDNLKELKDTVNFDYKKYFKDALGITNFMESIAYARADFEKVFKDKFKDYQIFVDLAKGETGYEDFEKIYRTLGTTTRDTVNSSLKQLNLSIKEMNKDESSIDKLREMSKTANGNRQVQQVAHQIQLKIIEQSKKLQQVLMSNVQVQNSWVAKQNAKEEMQEAAASLRHTGPLYDLTKHYGKPL